MANRRDVLRAGAVLPAVSLAAAPFASVARRGRAVLSLERFVFDVRFAESGAIAEHVEHAAFALAVADDLMTLWYDELDLAWRKAPMALAGVTLADTLFVLETFALDRGMHVVYRGEHGLVEDGRSCIGSPARRALIERLSPCRRRGRARWRRR